MTALTATELAKTRRVIGDNDPDNSNTYDLTDAQIQAAFDAAASNFLLTYVDCLEQRLGLAINMVDSATEIGGTSRSQKVRQIRELLDYWRMRAGALVYPVATVGEVSLGIDEEDSTFTNP